VVGETVGGIRDRRLPAWELGDAVLAAGRRGKSVVGLDWRPGLDGAGGLELVLLGLESWSRFLRRTIST
jgi:hypothetical protein